MREIPSESRVPRWRALLRVPGSSILVIPVSAFLAALFFVYSVNRDVRDAAQLSLHANATRATLAHLRDALTDSETAANGYLATKEPRFLSALENAQKAVGEWQARLVASNTPGDAAESNQLRQRIASEMDLLDQLRRGAGSAAAAREKAVMSDLLDGITNLDLAEKRRFAEAHLQGDAAHQRLFLAFILCGVAGPLGGVFLHFLIARRTAHRLHIVRENAARLAGGMALHPLPPGDDEIAATGREIESAAALLREREHELRESEGRYRHLFDHAPIPYGETDRNGVIRRVNQAMLRLIRCKPDQLLGRRFWDYVVPDRQEELRIAMMGRIERGEEIGPFDCDYLLDDGTYITVEVRENLARNDAGEVTGTVLSLLDVTERNLAAVAARKVEQYAMELRIRNEQLARALDTARAATVAKGRFLAGVSHELRTPLNSIIGFSELLHDEKLGPISPEQREVQADVLASAHHLLQLINDVLDLSKVESGKMEFHPERQVLRDLLVQVRDVLRPLADKKSLTLDVEAPADLVAMIDGGRFKQVLYNYLSNAVKFTPDGGHVTARILPEKGWFRLEVEDNGIGVTQEEVPRLFQEFSQLANSRHMEQGTGLGLSLTKHLVEAQGGSVGVRSQPGRGSVFTAVLPLAPLAGTTTA